MDISHISRQKAFEKLRSPCVELSQTTLQFRSHQTGARKVFDALQIVHKVLVDLGKVDALDEKLANYAFFPLQHIFNEAQRISSGCLELAVRCLQILVSRGWRAKLEPEMGKQLIVLMSLLAGGIPEGSVADSSSEELTLASLDCMADVFRSLGQGKEGVAVFEEIAARTLVDQSVYMLLEKISGDASPDVQASASKTLGALYAQISNRILLASLFPRTVSALTKALRATTRVRRMFKVLITNVQLLSSVIRAVLNDREAIFPGQPPKNDELQAEGDLGPPDSVVLDASWLKATAEQVGMALTHVAQLRYHNRSEVREALGSFCEMIIDSCFKSLSGSIPLMVETLVILARSPDDDSKTQAFYALSHLVSSNEALSEVLEAKIRSWTSSLPRIMQGSDDVPKQRILRQTSTGLEILARRDPSLTIVDDFLASSLCDSLAMALTTPKAIPAQILESQGTDLTSLVINGNTQNRNFDPVLFSDKGQQRSLAELNGLMLNLSNSEASNSLTKALLSSLRASKGSGQLSAMWLSLQLLRNSKSSFQFSDFIDVSSSPLFTRPYLIEELYSSSLLFIQEMSSSDDWRLSALSLEGLVLQAQQLGQNFRPELLETLYPVLSFLGSSQAGLQSHAVVALNLLAEACEYNDVSTMLVDNVDYLINAISLKLTYGDVSPQAAQVLLMMVRLCGARVIPYLDDMILSIFDVLDQYHGYPKLVEMLFEVLNVIVDEGAKQPRLAIASGKKAPNHGKTPFQTSSFKDIIDDLKRYKERLKRADFEHNPSETPPESHPKRPWTSKLDNPSTVEQASEPISPKLSSSPSSASSQHPEPEPQPENDKPAPLSKSHSLLLSILTATPPHLSSPSPRVRLTILRLIKRIAPLLSVDEDSFLPSINAIWPSLVARLESGQSSTAAAAVGAQRQGKAQSSSLLVIDQHPPSYTIEKEDQDQDHEPVYTVIAALEAIAAVCRTAGDFMTTRVEALFTKKLRRMYCDVYAAVYAMLQRQERRRREALRAKRLTELEVRSASRGIGKGSSSGVLRLRGNEAAVLKALVEVLVAVLECVRVDEDTGEEVVRLLFGVVVGVVVMEKGEGEGEGVAVAVGEKVGVDVGEVRRVCERWNGDLVWLLERESGMR